jgi:predicted nucleotidyltransferase
LAYIRWRGKCCELLATVYENGRSKKVILANIHDFYVPEWQKEEVARKFPGVKVDWLAVDREIAKWP